MIKPFDTPPMTEGQRKYRDEFLSSPEWITTRTYVITRDGGQCRICGCRDHLEVHHFCYDEDLRLTPDNLVTVCRRCHEVLSNAVQEAKGIRYNLDITRKRTADEAARAIGYQVNERNGELVASTLLELYKASLREGGKPINISNGPTVTPIAKIVTRTLDGQVECFVRFSGCNYKLRLDALVRDYRARAFLHYARQGYQLSEIQAILGLNNNQMAKVRKNAASMVSVVNGSG